MAGVGGASLGGGGSSGSGGSECRNYSSSSHTVAAHYAQSLARQRGETDRGVGRGSGWVVVLVGEESRVGVGGGHGEGLKGRYNDHTAFTHFCSSLLSVPPRSPTPSSSSVLFTRPLTPFSPSSSSSSSSSLATLFFLSVTPALEKLSGR